MSPPREKGSIIAGLKLSGIEAPDDQPVVAPTAKPTGRQANSDIVHTSIYLPRAVHRLLRDIAHTEERKIHDLIMEGIDKVLLDRAHPSVSELRAKGRT